MNDREINKILEELNKVRPEGLNKEAMLLFEAIMKIADERDDYKAKLINISEVCIDESKLHITSEQAIERIRNYARIK